MTNPYDQIRQLNGETAPLTARQVMDFIDCPRKYLLAAFATREQTREFIGGPAALGHAARQALAALYAAGGSATVTLEQTVAVFEEQWDGAQCRDSLEEEELHRQGLRMVREHYAAPLSVSEQAQTQARLEGEIGGHLFVAVADILDPATCTATRFTTSRRPPSAAQAAQDLSWGVLLLLASQALGAEAKGQLVALRSGEVIGVELGEEAQAGMTETLTSVARRIRRETQFEPVKGKQCRWCRSRRDCPAWRK